MIMVFRASAFNSFIHPRNERGPLVSRSSSTVARLLGDRDHDSVFGALNLGRTSCWNPEQVVLARERLRSHISHHGAHRQFSA